MSIYVAVENIAFHSLFVDTTDLQMLEKFGCTLTYCLPGYDCNENTVCLFYCILLLVIIPNDLFGNSFGITYPHICINEY